MRVHSEHQDGDMAVSEEESARGPDRTTASSAERADELHALAVEAPLFAILSGMPLVQLVRIMLTPARKR